MIALLVFLLSVPLPNATVTFSPGGTVTTDTQGKYSKELPKSWSGTITASFPGCIMLPSTISLNQIQTDTQVVEFSCQDVQSPVIQITTPKNNGTINRSAIIRSDTTDNIAVTRVVWSLDGREIGTITSAPWTLAYQFNKMSGWHILTAQAFDASGNQSTSSVRFKIR